MTTRVTSARGNVNVVHPFPFRVVGIFLHRSIHSCLPNTRIILSLIDDFVRSTACTLVRIAVETIAILVAEGGNSITDLVTYHWKSSISAKIEDVLK